MSQEDYLQPLTHCTLCEHRCGVNRLEGQTGICRMTVPVVASATLHPAPPESCTICSLANNHVLDWGYSGLFETMDTLKKVNIKLSGAGRNLLETQAPAVIKVPGKGRVIVFAFGSRTSGVPSSWGAADKRPGINLLRDLSDKSVFDIQEKVRKVERRGDIVVVSLHWGSNWGYGIPRAHTVFAHRLIDEVDVDIIHGHSSHHVRAIEVYIIIEVKKW